MDDITALRLAVEKAGHTTGFGRVSGLLFIAGDQYGCMRVSVPNSILLIPPTQPGAWWVAIPKVSMRRCQTVWIFGGAPGCF